MVCDWNNILWHTYSCQNSPAREHQQGARSLVSRTRPKLVVMADANMKRQMTEVKVL